MIREIGKMLGDLKIKNDQLKACLTEIKEIAESQCVNGCSCIDKKHILEKINEVLNDR
jgi:hypothetical protein